VSGEQAGGPPCNCNRQSISRSFVSRFFANDATRKAVPEFKPVTLSCPSAPLPLTPPPIGYSRHLTRRLTVSRLGHWRNFPLRTTPGIYFWCVVASWAVAMGGWVCRGRLAATHPGGASNLEASGVYESRDEAAVTKLTPRLDHSRVLRG
jgi:hypothetical protein